MNVNLRENTTSGTYKASFFFIVEFYVLNNFPSKKYPSMLIILSREL